MIESAGEPALEAITIGQEIDEAIDVNRLGVKPRGFFPRINC
jgi:hypothetical protein